MSTSGAVMRRLLFSAAVIGVAGGIVPATATPLAISGFSSQNVEPTRVEKVGYRRRQYRRYGYPVPYAYYPPAYGYYVPPPAYAYPPAYSDYPLPPANSDYPPADGDDGNYPPANGDYGDYPAENGY